MTRIRLSPEAVIKILRAWIEVVTQVLKDECDRLNEVFFYFITD